MKHYYFHKVPVEGYPDRILVYGVPTTWKNTECQLAGIGCTRISRKEAFKLCGKQKERFSYTEDGTTCIEILAPKHGR